MRLVLASAALALCMIACGGSDEPAPPTGCPDGQEKGPDGRCRDVTSACPAGTSELDGACHPEGCAPGSWDLGEGCVAAGTAGVCPPGEWLDEGGCRAAGVPAEACGPGFVAEDEGCRPILPASTCPVGEMAFLGDESCHPVMTCGSGTWGDIAVEPNTQYVDGSFAGVSDGTAAAPWTTLQQGVDAAEPGAIVAVAAGTYGRVNIGKPVRLFGRCPSMVTVDAGSIMDLGIVATGGSDGSVFRGLSVTNAAAGIVTADTQNVVAEQIVFHALSVGALASTFVGIGHLTVRDSLFENVFLSAGAGNGGVLTVERVHSKGTGTPAAFMALERAETPNTGEIYGVGEVHMRDSFVEDAEDSGALTNGGVLVVENSAIIGVAPGVNDGPGPGIGASPDMISEHLGELTVDGVYIERATSAGILAGGATVDIRHVTVVDILPNPFNHAGHGIHLTVELDTLGTDGTIRSSLVDDVIASGLLVADGTAEVEGVWVRNVRPYETGPEVGELGIGVQLRRAAGPSSASEVTLRGSRIEAATYAGFLAIDGTAHLEDVLILNTAADDNGLGAGVGARFFEGPVLPMTVINTRIEGSVGAGLFAAGVDLEVTQSSIVDTAAALQGSSSGIIVQHDGEATPSSALLRLVEIVGSPEVGVSVFGSSVRLEGLAIRDSRADADGRFGDGLLVSADLLPAEATVDRLSVTDSERAAIANFGGAVSYADSWLVCQTYDLDGEPSPLGDFSFDDRGGNASGCEQPLDECLVVTAALEAPSFLDL